MQGKVMGESIVIMDSFALPVQGTETRVNAASEANEYMVEYIEGSAKVHLDYRSHVKAGNYLRFDVPLGWETRKRDRVVSLSPRLRMLAVWN